MKKDILKTKNNSFANGMVNICLQCVPFCNIKRAVSSDETAHFRSRFGVFCNLLTINVLEREFDLSVKSKKNIT